MCVCTKKGQRARIPKLMRLRASARMSREGTRERERASRLLHVHINWAREEGGGVTQRARAVTTGNYYTPRGQEYIDSQLKTPLRGVHSPLRKYENAIPLFTG